MPREVPGSLDDEPSIAYTAGNQILITAKFTHPVTTNNPETGNQTDYVGLYLQIGQNCRIAYVVWGDGTNSIVFGYTVQDDDLDIDGISVEGGGPGTGL